MNKNDEEKYTPVGGYILSGKPITFNAEKPEIKLTVRNTGDRPIQIGSHFHFFEVNKALQFDRLAAYGRRLNIASTTAIRFEPGDEIDVPLIAIGGKQITYGFNNLVDGWTGAGTFAAGKQAKKDVEVKRAIESGYKSLKPAPHITDKE
ncbi:MULTISPECIES: urease subunit beta [Tenebrionibacter/Tenebrionicola group]|jgi:urease subunit beta|uniref:Urease subunit beta n=2 Tax=Tenebrionibacter/Tenebrionicola group TaxID=2969848 RepID=A0A8K0XXV1_9ENTR|nr:MULTISPECIES: urease subunit beta [Tenebrionibacter/Tenebrionicola group]MBK4716058.1 urease subunit beta [Tenebrionibacter intestinalis]MBV4411717.1 urease subunit beta [Tenebrionicola larvae]MBV5096752.1 urease subunit beta [Tenebrionicola larvae]